MAQSNTLILFIQSWEGGWTDNPADNGGATMRGITLAAVNASKPEQLFWQLREARITYLTGITERRPDQRQFLKGWLRRVSSITYTDLVPNN